MSNRFKKIFAKAYSIFLLFFLPNLVGSTGPYFLPLQNVAADYYNFRPLANSYDFEQAKQRGSFYFIKNGPVYTFKEQDKPDDKKDSEFEPSFPYYDNKNNKIGFFVANTIGNQSSVKVCSLRAVVDIQVQKNSIKVRDFAFIFNEHVQEFKLNGIEVKKINEQMNNNIFNFYDWGRYGLWIFEESMRCPQNKQPKGQLFFQYPVGLLGCTAQMGSITHFEGCCPELKIEAGKTVYTPPNMRYMLSCLRSTAVACRSYVTQFCKRTKKD